MKKYISILMVFVMLIAMSPMAFAEATVTTETKVTTASDTYNIGDKVTYAYTVQYNNSGTATDVPGASSKTTVKLDGATIPSTEIDTSSMSAGEHTITAEYAGDETTYKPSLGSKLFTLVYQDRTVTIDSTITNGTVTSDKSTAKKDDIVTLTVTPAEGYALKTISSTYEGGSVTITKVSDTTYTFPMPDKNVTVTATFEHPYTITTPVSPLGAGTATASPTTVTAGGTSKVTATEEGLYYFYTWTKDKGTLAVATDRETTFTAPTDVPTTTTSIEVKAEYIIGSVVSSDTNMGTVEIKKNSTTKSYDITATPKTGYKFTKWVLDSGNATFGSDTTASTTFTLNASDATAKAVFESLPSHTLTVKAGTGGTVTPTSATSIKEGLTATITATPSTGYVFSNWTVTGSGGVASSTSASTTYTMGAADATVTANFSKQNYTVYAGKYTGGAYGKAYVSYDNGSTWIEITTTSGTTLGTFASGTVLYFKMVPYTNYYSHPYVYSNTSGSYYAPTIYNYIFTVTVTDNITVRLNFTTTPPTGDTSVWQYVVAALASTGVGTGTVVALKRKKK